MMMRLVGAIHGVTVWIVTLIFLGVVTKAGTGFVMLKPPELVVMEGEVAIFTCSPLYSVAIPILERDGVIFESTPRLTHRDNGLNTMDGYRTYQLANVSRRETGTQLRCYMGGFFSNTITMMVVVPPKVSGPSGEFTLVEHGHIPIVFRYDISGFPHPSLTWHHDNTLFTGNARVGVADGASLTIRSPLRGDGGNYTLVVANTVGEVSLTLILRIVYNEFLESPSNVTVTTGGVVRMRCVHRFGWAYAWFSSKGALYTNTDKVTITDTGRGLSYGPVDYSDHTLTVYCVVHVRSTRRLFVSQQATIAVRFPPTVHAPSLTVAREGSDTLLEFVVHGYPPPTSTDFLYNEQPFTLNTRIQAREGPSLFIANVSRLDAGNYTISVTNGLGRASATTQLDVEYPPVILPLSAPVVAQVFRPIVLPCGLSFHGNPPPQVRWTTTSDLSFDERFRTDQTTGELSVSTTQYLDRGVYECIAVNAVGEHSTRVTLLVLDPPGQPTNVTILNIGPSWVSLAWSPPLAHGSQTVSAYAITATPHPTMLSRTPVTADSTAVGEYSANSTCVEVVCEDVEETVEGGRANVSGLVPGVEYIVVVRALSNGTNLQSEPSRGLHFSTGLSVPGIGSVSASVNGPGECIVQWTLAHSGGLPVQNFHIQFQRSNDSYWRNVTEVVLNLYESSDAIPIPPGQRTWSVHGLESFQLYYFRVQGVNEVGHGLYTSMIHPVLSHELGVPSRPTQPVITSWGSNHANISTSVAESGDGGVLDIHVVLLLNGVKVSSQIQTWSNHNLEMNIRYNNVSYRGGWQFKVIAVNSVGESEASLPSLPAREFVTEVAVVFGTAGPAIGGIVGMVNCIVLVITVIMCAQMCKEMCHRKKSMARRVEMAQATDQADTPPSPRMTFFGNLRDSPDGRSNPHIDNPPSLPSLRRPDHHAPIYATVATVTPPTPLSSVSMV